MFPCVIDLYQLPFEVSERKKKILKIELGALAGLVQLVRVLFHKLKGHEFDDWSGHMPRLQVRSSVGARARGN